jgi:1-acyl-sn-glycerol-3-phosphate acyltransferase
MTEPSPSLEQSSVATDAGGEFLPSASDTRFELLPVTDTVPKRGNGFSRWLGRSVFTLLGWRIATPVPDLAKAVCVIAPHSSNWDAMYGWLGSIALGIDCKWMAKSTLFWFPFGIFARWAGAVPVDRSGKAKGQAQAAADLIRNSDKMWLVIAPEGTRSNVGKWKTGFYRIAELADVPVLCCYIDYPSKSIGFGLQVRATGDLTADFAAANAWYLNFHGQTGKVTRIFPDPIAPAAANVTHGDG